MIKSNRVKAFISYNWYWYLLMIFFIIFIFYMVFEVKKTPSYDESINYFIASDKVETSSLNELLYNGVDKDIILKVNIDSSSPDNLYFSSIFNTRGMVNTDVIIIRDDYIKEGSYGTYFKELDLDILSKYFKTDNLLYLVDNEKTYGILVNDVIDDFINLDNHNYYLFFNASSNKIGELSSDSINDQALISISNLFK